MSIDWSKAPEGYPLWLEDLIHRGDGSKSCWAREGEGEYEFPGGGFWSYSVENLHYMVYRRLIQSTEPTADEQRDRFISTVYQELGLDPQKAERMFDLGYRKFEIVEEDV